jgi:hypothetical protein
MCINFFAEKIAFLINLKVREKFCGMLNQIKSGVSNSNSSEGHISKKKYLAGRNIL